MKHYKYIVNILFLLIVLSFSSCFEHVTPPCRIAKFYWEDQWHVAHYNSAGRLTQLIAPSSQVYFHYDASMMLEKAEIFTGGATPRCTFEFEQGPWGITEIDLFSYSSSGVEHEHTTIKYSSPTEVDSLIRAELPTDGSPGIEGHYGLTYVNNNVSLVNAYTINGVPVIYKASKYDKKKNPFRSLASAVGNPLFFPVCRMVGFPVSDYDISLLSLFSANNPLKATYANDDSGSDADDQTFDYGYQAKFATKILWTSVLYGIVDSEDYEFEFECGHRHGNNED